MNAEAVTNEKTNVKLGFFYSLGEVGSQLSWYMINSYLTLFYTDVVGLSAAAYFPDHADRQGMGRGK